MALQSTNLSTLSSIFNKKLIIPPYQREYAWGDEELNDLWNDLSETIEDDDRNYKHFFGQIVVHSSNSTLTIVDGQQRITTCNLLVACLSNAYRVIYDGMEDKESREAKKLNRKITKNEDLLGIDTTDSVQNQKPNLVQNDADKEYFIQLLLDASDTRGRRPKKSQDRMRKACIFFNKKINELLDDEEATSKKLDALEDCLETLKERFIVMYIEATELDEAFTIFETLNARGKDLASADLLKNHLFTTGRNINESKRKWEKMLETLEGLDLTKYIRYYWNSFKPFTRDKKLYKSISSFVRDHRESKNFLDDLNEYAGYYHDIACPDSPSTFSNTELLDALKGLSTLGASTFYPIVIAMVRRKDNDESIFSESDIASIVKTVETYVFRNSTICGQLANKAEKKFASIACEISDKSINTVEEISSKIKEDMVTDEEFKNSFILYDRPNKDRIRYIFRKIHKHLSTGEINRNNMEVHIEHIMPEDMTQWASSGITEDQHDEFLWRLGNLCLLNGPFNIEISNKTFDEKKQRAYINSEIKPNNELVNYDTWNIDKIIERQEKLFTYALQIWG